MRGSYLSRPAWRGWRALLALALTAQCVAFAVPASVASALPTASVRWPSPTWHIGGAGNQDGPCGIDVDAAGNVYVADTENSRIDKFDAAGELVARWGGLGSGNGQFDRPMGIAVDLTNQYLYVADTGNNRIQQLTVAGGFVRAWGEVGPAEGYFSAPEGLDVDSAGNVYVADTGNARIQKFDAAGVRIGGWGTPGDGDSQFLAPSDVAVDASNHVYVVDRDSLNCNVRYFDESGAFILRWGSPKAASDTFWPGYFSGPSGIAVDSTGFVYVTDTKNHRIQKFNADGSFPGGTPKLWGVWGKRDLSNDSKPLMVEPTGIAVSEDAEGIKILVTDRLNDRVRFFDDDGFPLQIRGSYGLAGGRFNTPAGIAVGSDGRVFVTEMLNHRIQSFTSEGTGIGERPYFSSAPLPGDYNGSPVEAETVPVFNEPLGVAIDAAGFVFVADSKNDRVMKRATDSSFSYETKWGAEGTGNGFLDTPSGVAVGTVAATETVFVADTGNDRIQLFDKDGAYRGQWGAGTLNEPRGVALDTTSSAVYVADTGNHRIVKCSTGGEVLKTWGSLGSAPGQFKLPWGVAVDAFGNVYVADTGNNRVQVFDAEGGLLGTVGMQGSESGQLEAPRAIAVALDGRIYVADSGNHRVHVFLPPVAVVISGVTDSGAYNHAVTPSVGFLGTNLTQTGIQLNGQDWDPQLLSADGDYTLAAWASSATDYDSASVSFCIDRVKPSTSSNAGPSYTGPATITLSPTDDRSGVKTTRWRVDGEAPWREGTTVVVGKDGPHTLEFYSEDRAGNVEGPAKSVEFDVDNPDFTPPSTTLGGAPDGWVNHSVQITLTGDDGASGSGVAASYYRIGSGEDTRYEGPVTVDVLTAGQVTVTYWSVDEAGNAEMPKARTIGFDKIAPVTAAAPAGSFYAPVQIQLTAADSGGSGLAATYWRVAPDAAWNFGTVATMTGVGSKTLQYYSTDAAGNSEGVKSATYTLKTDPTAPTLTYATSFGLGVTTLSLTAADGESGVSSIEYQVNGGTVERAWNASAIVPVTRLGGNEVTFRATNNVGVSSTWRTLSVVVKNTVVSLSAPSTCSYKSATLSGYARATGSSGVYEPLARRYVRIERRSGDGWVLVTRALTDTSGRYSIKVGPTKTTVYRASYEGSASSHLSASSPQRTVKPKASLSKPSLSTTRLKAGKAYSARGTVKPAHASGTRQLTMRAYRRSGRTYVLRKTFTVRVSARSGYSKYVSTVKLTRGTWRIRIVHASDSANATSYSAYRYLTVK